MSKRQTKGEYFIEFLIDVTGKDFTFKAKNKYEILDEDDTRLFILQPNSPKGKNWVTTINKSNEGKIFKSL